MKINFVRLSSYPAPIRLGIFLLTLLVVWVPIASPIAWLVRDPNLVTILTMGLLFVDFLLLAKFWGEKVYRQPQMFLIYGLVKTQQNAREFFFGLILGLLFIGSLFAVQGQLGWLVWQKLDVSLIRIVGEGFLSALGIGFAEELVFRGWLLFELQRDYRPQVILWADAVIFAILHFLKPLPEMFRTLPQFPALLLLGLTLVWAKQGSQGRLGLPIGLHAGLVWGYYMINLGQLVEYSHRVPDWMTGIDRSPMAGVMGLIFLSVLAFLMQQRCSKSA